MRLSGRAQPEKISQRFFYIPSSPPSRPHNHFTTPVPRAALLQHPSHDEFQEVEDTKSDRLSRGEHLNTTIVAQIRFTRLTHETFACSNGRDRDSKQASLHCRILPFTSTCASVFAQARYNLDRKIHHLPVLRAQNLQKHKSRSISLPPALYYHQILC